MLLRYFPIGSDSQTIELKGSIFLIGSSSDNDAVISGLPPVAIQCENRGERWQISLVPENATLTVNGVVQKQCLLNSGIRIECFSHFFVADNRENKSQANQIPNQVGVVDIADEVLNFLGVMSREKDLKTLLDVSLNQVLKIFKGTEAFLFTLDGYGKPKAAAGKGVLDAEQRFSDTIVQEAIRNGEGVVLPQAFSDERFKSAQSISDLKLNTVVCAPILFAGRLTGVVYVGCRKPAISYGPLDLKTLSALGQALGLLVHHAEFIAEQGEAMRSAAKSVSESGFVAQSPAMQKVLRNADAIAGSDITVMLHGETGTGKEIFAERLHRKSRRAKGPFTAVNSGSLKSELLESELFGYKRGAFTGALNDRAGLFSAAHGGTLFLDEIGELDFALQAKLLRALETGRIRPVGGVEEILVDVRVVAATNRDLKAMIQEGKFREDLYFRLAQVTLEIPPLRDREEDIRLLAYCFLERFCEKYPEKEAKDFHPRSLEALQTYSWPGNVRELQCCVHKGVLLAQSPLVFLETGTPSEQGGDGAFLGFEEATAKFQKKYLHRALSLKGGNREQAAKLLNMSRSTFFRYLADLGVS